MITRTGSALLALGFAGSALLVGCGSDSDTEEASAPSTALASETASADAGADSGSSTGGTTGVTADILGDALVQSLTDAESFTVDGDTVTVNITTDLPAPQDKVQCSIATTAADAFEELEGVRIVLKMPSSSLDCSTV